MNPLHRSSLVTWAGRRTKLGTYTEVLGRIVWPPSSGAVPKRSPLHLLQLTVLLQRVRKSVLDRWVSNQHLKIRVFRQTKIYLMLASNHLLSSLLHRSAIPPRRTCERISSMKAKRWTIVMIVEMSFMKLKHGIIIQSHNSNDVRLSASGANWTAVW